MNEKEYAYTRLKPKKREVEKKFENNGEQNRIVENCKKTKKKENHTRTYNQVVAKRRYHF